MFCWRYMLRTAFFLLRSRFAFAYDALSDAFVPSGWKEDSQPLVAAASGRYSRPTEKNWWAFRLVCAATCSADTPYSLATCRNRGGRQRRSTGRRQQRAGRRCRSPDTGLGGSWAAAQKRFGNGSESGPHRRADLDRRRRHVRELLLRAAPNAAAKAAAENYQR